MLLCPRCIAHSPLCTSS